MKFHDRTILKVSGNYNAAFNFDLLTQNERANHVVDDIIIPILPLLAKSFPDNLPFDVFGFEIAFHIRTHSKQFGYEGKEILALVFDKADVTTFLNTDRRSTRQEIIDRSQVYLDGKEFGLALGEKKPSMWRSSTNPSMDTRCMPPWFPNMQRVNPRKLRP